MKTLTGEVPTMVVSGLGRCGSSLVMQMLDVGGMHCAGSAPDYEDPRAYHPIDDLWFSSLGESAVKVLDPHRSKIPATAPVVVIWLDRDFEEQAKSQAKMLVQAGVVTTMNREQRQGLAKTLRRDRREALVAIDRLNLQAPVLRLAFEDLISNPSVAALQLGYLLARWRTLDTTAMQNVVLPRSPFCARDMAIEAALVADLRRGSARGEAL